MSLLLVALAAVPLAGIVIFLVRRHRRRARALGLLGDDADFELRFPDAPADHAARATVRGRRIGRP